VHLAFVWTWLNQAGILILFGNALRPSEVDRSILFPTLRIAVAATFPGLSSCTCPRANAGTDTQADPSKTILIRVVASLLYLLEAIARQAASLWLPTRVRPNKNFKRAKNAQRRSAVCSPFRIRANRQSPDRCRESSMNRIADPHGV